MGTTYEVDNAVATTLTNATETVVATLPGISSQRPGQRVSLRGHVNVTTGTTTTGLVLRVRLGTVTGTLVDLAETEVTAEAVGSAVNHEIVADDTPAGEYSQQTYVLTVVQTAATANGTCNHAELRAETLP